MLNGTAERSWLCWGQGQLVSEEHHAKTRGIEHALAGGLDSMISCGPFQPLQFRDSVKTRKGRVGENLSYGVVYYGDCVCKQVI